MLLNIVENGPTIFVLRKMQTTYIVLPWRHICHYQFISITADWVNSDKSYGLQNIKFPLVRLS